MTTEFNNTNTRGFSAADEPEVAVCLLPGTEIAFKSEVRRMLTGFLMAFSKKGWQPIAHKAARFRQVNLDNPYSHHDALEFPDGQIALVTHLRVGQKAAVLQLPAQISSPARTEASDAPRGACWLTERVVGYRLPVRSSRLNASFGSTCGQSAS